MILMIKIQDTQGFVAADPKKIPPFTPPSGPALRLFQKDAAKSKFLAVR